MNKKRIIIISIIAIVLLIGGSFAYWRLSLVQTSTNNIATSCFDLSLSEENPINLQSAFPITDAEGKTLTPYEFTVTNNCTTYAYYEVNLEVLNNTDLDSQYIKMMLDDEEPVLLSSKIVTTTTLSNATTSYKLAKAYMHASESKTYHLRLWLDESVTLADNVTEKEFSSKITIRATYKPEAPSSQEECELEYGKGAAVCSIIANADTTNSKCLQTDENGKITNYSSTMSDSDTPIVCSMEDDYGTSYYLRGLHTNNNVKFADSCWKIIRTTGTGGIKMIYNGDLDSNSKCTTTEGTHNGFAGQTLSLSGNKLYGTSYTKEGSTYTLTNTSTMKWSDNVDNIIGMYTCGNTSNSCTTLYAITGENNSSSAYAVKIDQSTNYAQIGTSAFNNRMGKLENVGYMYDDSHEYSSFHIIDTSGTQLMNSINESNSNYYYGDTIVYNSIERYYYITNQDGSNVVQLDWASNYQNNLVGKYTCKGTSKFNDTTIICARASKVLDTTSKTNYMLTEDLSRGRLSISPIRLAESYSLNNGTYTLINPVTLSAMDWYNDYSNYKDYYYCEDWNQVTCTVLYKILYAESTSIRNTITVSNDYYYGSSFTYDETNPTRPYTLTNAVHFWDLTDSTNQTSLNTHHYTCLNSVDNTCDKLFYIYDKNSTNIQYIKLKNNETIENALDQMLGNNVTSLCKSDVSGVINWWYRTNIKDTIYENYLEDTIFCNSRIISDSWSQNSNVGNIIIFNSNRYLKCLNKRDAFTASDTENGNGSLIYPIGLLTNTEHSLIGNYEANKTGADYWTLEPARYNSNAYEKSIQSNGKWGGDNASRNSLGVRPSISLKPGIKFVTGGDGSASNPYEVDMS